MQRVVIALRDINEWVISDEKDDIIEFEWKEDKEELNFIDPSMVSLNSYLDSRLNNKQNDEEVENFELISTLLDKQNVLQDTSLNHNKNWDS